MRLRSLLVVAFALLPLRAAAVAEAGLVERGSWWDVDTTTRRVWLQLVGATDFSLARLAPEGTEFFGPVGTLELRAGYALDPWVVVDAGVGGQWGASSGLFGGGRSERAGAIASLGVRVAPPLRITPFLGVRFGYSYADVDWKDYDGGLFSADDGELVGQGADTVHAFFVRAEVGALFHLTDRVAFSLGFHGDFDMVRTHARTLALGSAGDYPVGDGVPAKRALGAELGLIARF